MRNGSWSLPASFSVAGTAIRDALPSQVIVTSAQSAARYSQYNETSYARYVLEDAQRRGMPRAMLERDAKLLSIDVGVDGRLDFQGRADFRPAEGGAAASWRCAAPRSRCWPMARPPRLA